MADAVLANDRRRNGGGLLVYFGEMPGTSDEQRAIHCSSAYSISRL
jgi:hypothetical protein